MRFLKQLKQKLKEEIAEFKRTMHWIKTGEIQKATIYDSNFNSVSTTAWA
tara:strand:- start:31698 stop:31847 length:150 start_codon:yes stop_codon:yes gene_type:complete